MSNFINDLIERGRVVVAPEPVALPVAELEGAIRQLDADARAELPHRAPQLSIPAASWALRLIENACRFLTYREFDSEVITASLHETCPLPPSPDCSYSADLFLQHLPEVTRLARSAGEGDPLVEQLQIVAVRWPLSSVGMAGVKCKLADVEAILDDPCLRQLYVDRIIERSDETRLEPLVVRDAVRASLGAYPSLTLNIMRAIEEIEVRV